MRSCACTDGNVCAFEREPCRRGLRIHEKDRLTARGFGSHRQVSAKTGEQASEAIGKITKAAAGYKWTDDNCERIPAMQVAMQVGAPGC